jgi:hypothetical protein
VRGNQGADARIESHFLVDGAHVALKGTGLPPLGLAHHGDHQQDKKGTRSGYRRVE